MAADLNACELAVCEVAYMPADLPMLSCGTALMRSTVGSMLVLCSPSQLLVLVLDHLLDPVPHGLQLRPLELPRAASASFVGIDATPDGALLAIALSSSHPSDRHEVVLMDAPLEAWDVLRIAPRSTLQLTFAPLAVRWLGRRMLAITDASCGRVNIFSVPDDSSAIIELAEEQSSAALGGLSPSLPSPVLALAEWSSAGTGWSARMLGCEDGTLELSIGHAGGVTRQSVRVERSLNAAFFFAADRAAADGATTPTPLLHLFVGSVLGGACIYTDVLVRALRAPVRALADDQSVLCSSAWGARPATLLVGTWGRMLHCMRLAPARGGRAESALDGSPAGWRCVPLWSKELPHAPYAIRPFDVSGDGLDELVVRTLGGVHVLQEDLPSVCAELELGLERLVDEAAPGGQGRAARSGACAELRERLTAVRHGPEPRT